MRYQNSGRDNTRPKRRYRPNDRTGVRRTQPRNKFNTGRKPTERDNHPNNDKKFRRINKDTRKRSGQIKNKNIKPKNKDKDDLDREMR